MRFPIFVELEGKKCVVAGGGMVGTRRAKALAEYGADVLVIAPALSEELAELAKAGRIRVERRTASEADMEDAFFVVAAADSREVNRCVAEWCRKAGVPVNVADKKEESDFYFPGLAREGSLTAGICADGTDHRLAKQATAEIRTFLQERFGEKDGR